MAGPARASLLAYATPKAMCLVDGEIGGVERAAWHVVRQRALQARFELPMHLEDLEVEAQHAGTAVHADAFMHTIWLSKALGASSDVDIPCAGRSSSESIRGAGAWPSAGA